MEAEQRETASSLGSPLAIIILLKIKRFKRIIHCTDCTQTTIPTTTASAGYAIPKVSMTAMCPMSVAVMSSGFSNWRDEVKFELPALSFSSLPLLCRDGCTLVVIDISLQVSDQYLGHKMPGKTFTERENTKLPGESGFGGGTNKIMSQCITGNSSRKE